MCHSTPMSPSMSQRLKIIGDKEFHDGASNSIRILNELHFVGNY